MTLTNQEIFNKALNGIRNQNYQPSMSGDACQYRGPNGTACAVGHCIPQEVAEKWDKLPDSTIHSVSTGRAEEYGQYFTGEQISFLIAIQSAHDSKLRSGSDFFETEMSNLAIRYQLEYTKP